jgi:TrmH family RNA methyltransferase
VITSPHNEKLKEVRRLHRRREGRFVAEGEDLLAAAVHVGWPAVYELRSGVDVEPELLDAVSGLGSGTRALGVYEQRWGAPVGPLCVALWGVHDPGNVGTVLRGALAFGASSVAIGPDTADPFGPKAVRASMGAIFAVPVARVHSVAELPAPRVALDARAPEPLASLAAAPTEPLRPATLVVGAERTGLPADVLAACDHAARIPIAGDSLNAAMAATIAMYELRRGAGGAHVGAGGGSPGDSKVPDR